MESFVFHVFSLLQRIFAKIKKMGHLYVKDLMQSVGELKKNCCHNYTLPSAGFSLWTDASEFSYLHAESSIMNLLLQINASNIATNRYIIKCMAAGIIPCAKQCIALRGHRNDSTADS